MIPKVSMEFKFDNKIWFKLHNFFFSFEEQNISCWLTLFCGACWSNIYTSPIPSLKHSLSKGLILGFHYQLGLWIVGRLTVKISDNPTYWKHLYSMAPNFVNFIGKTNQIVPKKKLSNLVHSARFSSFFFLSTLFGTKLILILNIFHHFEI